MQISEATPAKRQKQETLCPCYLNHSYRCGKHSVFRTVLNRQLDPRLIKSRDNLTWQWITCSKLAIEQPLRLDCGVLDNTMLPKRTATSLQFLPSNGELLLAANMDQVSIFNFDFYRLQASKPNNGHSDYIGVPSEVDFPFAGQYVESVQWNPHNEAEFCAIFPSARLVRVMDIETGEEKLKQSIMGTGPVPTCTLFQDNNVLLVGTSVGGIRGFDLRSRRGILTFDHPSKHPVVGLLSSHSNKLVVAAFGNGDVCEFSGTKQVQQAFAAKLPILNETKRVTNRVGISALCALPNSPFGDICVACVDGSIQCFNPLQFRFNVDHVIRSSENRAQDIQFYAPQPTTTERASHHLINVKNCLGFGTQSRYLFSVKRFNENTVEVFDLHATARRRLFPQAEEESFCKIKTVEFKRNISAIAVHPDSDVLVCALQKSSMLEIRGLI